MQKRRLLPPFIQKRRKRFYAVLEIPKSLRQHYSGRQPGKNLVRLVRSLETDSLTVAERRVGPVVSAWKSEFARLKNEGDDAFFYRRRLQKAKTEAERQQVMSEIELAAGDIGPTYSEDVSTHRAAEEQAAGMAEDFAKRATGQLVGFTDHLDAFLERSVSTEKTKAMQRSDLVRFAVSFPTVQDVTYAGVQRWVDALGVEPATIRRTLSALRGYWRYLQRPDIKAVPREFQPFTELDLPKARNSPRDRRRPFDKKDFIRLSLASRNDPELLHLIFLGMWTGCRLEEICSLKTNQVHFDASIPYIEIEDAKTPAGWRQVPIHERLQKTMVHLVQESKDGYVLSGQTTNKYGDRSNAIGKRFGRLKSSLG
ncbi:MAG: hypothetical protein O7A66_02205, partial [Alphaproteobacteria bacterium]|nr:hypothetical protein [Alphaproteobacteria bacterium]